MIDNFEMVLSGVKVYFNPAQGKFFYKYPNHKSFTQLGKDDLKVELLKMGFKVKPFKDSDVPEVDVALSWIRQHRQVDMVCEIAGHDAGLYDVQGKAVLVSQGIKLIEPVEGPWDGTRCFIDNLLGEEQARHFYGWFHVALRGLYQKKFLPGQVLVLAGPADCGKSFLQRQLTFCFGGRSAKAHQYMMGQTAFNSDLFGAEHLMIEDDRSSMDITNRRNFGSQIKDVTVNVDQRCHGKGKDAFILNPLWRLSMSMNDEAENMMVLPPLDESLRDKMIICKVSRFAFKHDTGTPEGRKAFENMFEEERAAFIYWALNVYTIPPDLTDRRFGITGFVNEELLYLINESSPEARLLELIDNDIFNDPSLKSWQGKATEIERELLNGGFKDEARKIFTFANACGTYLSRLKHKYPKRIEKRKVQGQSVWRILPGQFITSSLAIGAEAAC